jgi:hypothetical protein
MIVVAVAVVRNIDVLCMYLDPCFGTIELFRHPIMSVLLLGVRLRLHTKICIIACSKTSGAFSGHTVVRAR